MIYGRDTWQSPATWQRRWLAGVFAVSAGYAGIVALTSTEPVHRLWGEIAACGYGVALLCVLGTDLALGAALLGALVVPLTVLAVRNMRQPEVDVIARSASLLVHHGTPYESTAQLAATAGPNAYNPYLPVMSLFGLPRAIFGGGFPTDPRVWFALAFIVAFGLAVRIGGAIDAVRWTALVAASPIVALELSAGGDDGPMVAFLCLGFALLTARSARAITWAGIALGLAAGMKATTWPALAVAFALLVARDGWRAASRFAGIALAVLAICVGPFLTHPKALVDNTIKFPLGLAGIQSAAASPLPGHPHDRRRAAGAGRRRSRGDPGDPPAGRGPARRAAAGRGDDAHVPPGAVDPVRLLHLPGNPRPVAARRGDRTAGQRAGSTMRQREENTARQREADMTLRRLVKIGHHESVYSGVRAFRSAWVGKGRCRRTAGW